MIDVINSFGTVFSTDYLNLQKDFCCDTGSLKLIRWVGCKPGIYKGQKNLFASDDMAMCNWAQGIANYAYSTIDFEPGAQAELQFNGILYFFAKATWEANSLDSLKQIEIGFNQQGGVIGSTIPFNIDPPSPPIYNYQLMRDIYHINTTAHLVGPMKINNCSPYNVSISMLYAY